MSADNWAKCPRCYKTGQAALKAQQEELDLAYGKVPLKDFDTMRAELNNAAIRLANIDPTFREDYEFYGAETGVVNFTYSGQCTKCGLKLKFEGERPIPDL